MSRIGRYKTPKEFKDEDIWFKWFTKKQIIYLVVCAGISFVIFTVLQKIHLTLIGAMLVVILMLAGFMVPRMDMPADKYLIGGGMPLEQVMLRILVKKFLTKKKIYISSFTEKD